MTTLREFQVSQAENGETVLTATLAQGRHQCFMGESLLKKTDLT